MNSFDVYMADDGHWYWQPDSLPPQKPRGPFASEEAATAAAEKWQKWQEEQQ